MSDKIKVTKALKELNPELDAKIGEEVESEGLVLKAPTGSDNGGTDDGGTKVKGKKIEVNEDLLRELINSNKEMAKQIDRLESNAAVTGPNGIQVRRKVKDFDYTLRLWEGKIVLGFDNMGSENRPLYVYNIYNKDTRAQEQFVNLMLEGQKEAEKVDYLTFLRDAERLLARKVSQIEHEDVKEYGMIPKKEMADNSYGMYETMVLVPVEVTTKTYTLTLRLPEKDFKGREVVINSKWVNM